MRFVFRTPKGSTVAIAKFRKADALEVMRRILPGATYLGPVAPHMVPAIIAAKPATPEELRIMRRVLPAEPFARDMLPPVRPCRFDATKAPTSPHDAVTQALIDRRMGRVRA